jgi:hypothetical protein
MFLDFSAFLSSTGRNSHYHPLLHKNICSFCQRSISVVLLVRELSLRSKVTSLNGDSTPNILGIRLADAKNIRVWGLASGATRLLVRGLLVSVLAVVLADEVRQVQIFARGMLPTPGEISPPSIIIFSSPLFH